MRPCGVRRKELLGQLSDKDPLRSFELVALCDPTRPGHVIYPDEAVVAGVCYIDPARAVYSYPHGTIELIDPITYRAEGYPAHTRHVVNPDNAAAKAGLSHVDSTDAVHVDAGGPIRAQGDPTRARHIIHPHNAVVAQVRDVYPACAVHEYPLGLYELVHPRALGAQCYQPCPRHVVHSDDAAVPYAVCNIDPARPVHEYPMGQFELVGGAASKSAQGRPARPCHVVHPCNPRGKRIRQVDPPRPIYEDRAWIEWEGFARRTLTHRTLNVEACPARTGHVIHPPDPAAPGVRHENPRARCFRLGPRGADHQRDQQGQTQPPSDHTHNGSHLLDAVTCCRGRPNRFSLSLPSYPRKSSNAATSQAMPKRSLLSHRRPVPPGPLRP